MKKSEPQNIRQYAQKSVNSYKTMKMMQKRVKYCDFYGKPPQVTQNTQRGDLKHEVRCERREKTSLNPAL